MRRKTRLQDRLGAVDSDAIVMVEVKTDSY